MKDDPIEQCVVAQRRPHRVALRHHAVVAATRPQVENRQLQTNIGDLVLFTRGDAVSCSPLGTCVFIVVYAPDLGVGGAAHCLLPSAASRRLEHAEAPRSDHFPGKYVDIAIPHIMTHLHALAIARRRLVAKLVGGGSVIQFEDQRDVFTIGERNVQSARKILREFGVRLIGQDVGGHVGRVVRFYPENGELHISGTNIPGERIL